MTATIFRNSAPFDDDVAVSRVDGDVGEWEQSRGSGMIYPKSLDIEAAFSKPPNLPESVTEIKEF
jgi:hypothetical protein